MCLMRLICALTALLNFGASAQAEGVGKCSVLKPNLTLFEDEKAPNLFGYKDQDGEVAIKPVFSIAREFEAHGFAYAGGNFIDTRGDVHKKPFHFDNGPDYFSEGLARFVEGGKIGFMDECLMNVIEPGFDFAFPFSGGVSAVCVKCKKSGGSEHHIISGGLWGAVNILGKTVVPIKFSSRELALEAVGK